MSVVSADLETETSINLQCENLLGLLFSDSDIDTEVKSSEYLMKEANHNVHMLKYKVSRRMGSLIRLQT